MKMQVNAPSSVAATMQLVLLALVPGIAVFFYQNGWGSIINIVLAIVSALAFESLAQLLRKRSPRTALQDYSAVVTAVLIALCLPPLLPWWIPVLASGFAILLAKHAFGGIGNNPFNPAMVGYAMVLISFPTELSLWLNQPESFSLNLSAAIHAVFNGGVVELQGWDALTGATALDQHRTMLIQIIDTGATINTEAPPHGIPGVGQNVWTNGVWINIAYLLGGCWMMWRRIISWHIPVSFLATLLFAVALHNVIHTQTISVPIHLFGGATMLCAFFISTDPVSAAASNRGRIIYAALTGLLVYLIRTWGAYPDGVAFAVLLANSAVPAIDRLDIWLRHTANESANE